MRNGEIERKYGEKFLEMVKELMDTKTGFNWMKPCYLAGGNVSYSTGREYNGMNRLFLEMLRVLHGYKSRVWITFNQVKELQRKHPEVRIEKGCKMAPVIFWKAFNVEDEDEQESEEEKESRNVRFMLKQYYVYNTDCISGYEFKQPIAREASEKEVHSMDEYIELLTKDYRNGAPKVYCDRNGRNFYRPSIDEVHLTRKEQFKSPEEFLSTCAHELVHSTGHFTRLDRLSGKDADFGSNDYGLEELVAEFGASMICAEFGVSERVIDNQAEYLKNWYLSLKEKPEMLPKAFKKAEKAVAWILGK